MGGFPAGENDVLGHAYGTCEDNDACFQRLPAFVVEEGTELLVRPTAATTTA